LKETKNTEADDLAKVVAHKILMPANVFFQVIEDASVKTVVPEPRLINVIEGEDWRSPIMAYHRHYYELASMSKSECNNEPGPTR
jgi:hypothetical protein